MYRLKQEYTKSAQALKKAYELDPTKSTVLFEIATTYESMKNSENQAIKYYDAYLKSLKEGNVEYRKLTKYALERNQVLKDELNRNKKFPGKNQ